MKKYLTTPEEVIKALKEGKKVKSEDGWFYKLVDGIIVGVDEFEGWKINLNLDLYDKIYIEETEPLKIEVGKFYKTKGNKKAYVYLDYRNGLFRAVCDYYTNSYCIDDKGEYTNYPKVDKLSLVSPWEE